MARAGGRHEERPRHAPECVGIVKEPRCQVEDRQARRPTPGLEHPFDDHRHPLVHRWEGCHARRAGLADPPRAAARNAGGSPATGGPQRSGRPGYAARMTAKAQPPIVILGRDTCEDTTRSLALLARRQIPYGVHRGKDATQEAGAWIRACTAGDDWRPSRGLGPVVEDPGVHELKGHVSCSAGLPFRGPDAGLKIAGGVCSPSRPRVLRVRTTPGREGRRPRDIIVPMLLTARQLNRATFGRQLLLQREPLDVVGAVHRVVALQAQEPASPYLALWNRLVGLRSHRPRSCLRRPRCHQGHAHAHRPARRGRSRLPGVPRGDAAEPASVAPVSIADSPGPG